MLWKYDRSAAIWLAASAAVLALGGCASGEDGDGNLATGASGGAGATSGGGAPTTGGGGGTGAVGPCEQDCSLVDAPDCYVAVCNDGKHPGQVGACVVVEAEGGTPCDDGLFCTTQDGCQAGRCIGGPENTCGMLPPECQQVVCDEGTGTCNFQPAEDATPCASDDLCKVNAQCIAGECSEGVPKDCTFAPVGDCNEAVCNPFTGMCEGIPANDGAPCTDPMDLCTLGRTCDAGQCTGGTPKDCSILTQGCDLGVCDPQDGMCVTQAGMNGAPCDDLDACTLGETCNAGTCDNGTPITACDLTPDGCCPSTCTAVDDPDCAGMPSWIGASPAPSPTKSAVNKESL